MNAPKLRFPEFTGEWQQCKLGDIGSVSMCKRIFKEQTTENGDIPFYKIGTFGGKADAYISKDLFEEYKAKYPFPKIGDILISASGSIGRTVEFNGENAYFQDSNIVWLNHDERVDNSFLKQFYSIVKWSGLEGSAIKRLYNSNILKTEISLPSLSEQQKIASLFTELDTLIQSAEKELEGYRELKQGMLQKMFPKKGEKVPEVRFPEFTGDWEKRKLEDIANRFDNLRVPVASSLRIKGTTPYYGANGIQDYVDGFTHEGEYVLVAEDGANDLINYPVNYVNGRIWVNNHAHVLQGKDNVVNNRYLSYAISRVNMQSVLVGGGRAKLNAEVMMNLDLFLPSIAEQKKIGEYFSNLDSLITLQQQELDGYKELKKGLLQQMFC